MEEEPEEYDEGLTEQEKAEFEKVLLEKAYDNTYRMLTEKITLDELMDEKSILGMAALLAYDPERGIRKHELVGTIEYYVDIEEYEKLLTELEESRAKRLQAQAFVAQAYEAMNAPDEEEEKDFNPQGDFENVMKKEMGKKRKLKTT